MNRIVEYFVDGTIQFTQQEDFEAAYDATCYYMFHEYFDGLPRGRWQSSDSLFVTQVRTNSVMWRMMPLVVDAIAGINSKIWP